MTLAKRLTIKSTVLVLCVAILVVCSAAALTSVDRAARVAHDEYLELRMILDIAGHIATGRNALFDGDGQTPEAGHLESAERLLEQFEEFQAGQRRDFAQHEAAELTLVREARANMHEALRLLEPKGAARSRSDSPVILASLQKAEGSVRRLVEEMDGSIAAAHRAADQTRRGTLLAIAVVSAGILIATVLVNISVYRGVMFPLRRLREGSRRIAQGRFDERVNLDGNGEFREVADEFNQMAVQLQELYGNLEGKVREMSRELVRSERLASVGYLAAGVAHEINNPLNIISGYAELALKRLRNENGPALDETQRALRIIRDESFRCKAIIENLLSLASGGKPRERVSLYHVADDVVSMLASLKPFRSRRIEVQCDPAQDMEILSDETELKQVLLNLVLNALHAVEPEVGRVRLDGKRRNGTVELCVSDNGRGMAPETLERVFEPFFSLRNGPDEAHGLGLGLSITHAIVESNGGRIRAESDGLGRGSRFIVEFPAAKETETP